MPYQGKLVKCRYCAKIVEHKRYEHTREHLEISRNSWSVSDHYTHRGAIIPLANPEDFVVVKKSWKPRSVLKVKERSRSKVFVPTAAQPQITIPLTEHRNGVAFPKKQLMAVLRTDCPIINAHPRTNNGNGLKKTMIVYIVKG
jgi:hypothetical protein